MQQERQASQQMESNLSACRGRQARERPLPMLGTMCFESSKRLRFDDMPQRAPCDRVQKAKFTLLTSREFDVRIALLMRTVQIKHDVTL